MNISVKLEKGNSPLENTFQIHVPPEEVDKIFQKAYHKIRHRVNLKGFRKGKVPKNHLRNLYGIQVSQDSAQDMMVQGYDEALKKHGMIPVGNPHFHIESPAQEGKTFEFRVEFELLPDFSSIKYSPLEMPPTPPLKTEEDMEKDVEATLNILRENLASYEDVKDSDIVATKDHIAILDVIAKDEKGEEISHFNLKDFHMSLEKTLINKSFMEQVLGMKQKELKEFQLDLEKEKETHYIESEGGSFKSLKGFKKVHFSVEMKALKTKHLPELNEEFVKERLKIENLQKLKENIKQSIQKEDRQKVHQHLRDGALSALLEKKPPFRYLLKF